MKIQVMSDLHLEFDEYEPLVDEADVVILAGDIYVGDKGIKWVEKHIKFKPVVYVLGNHEYWKHAHPKLINDLQVKTKNTNIHILENSVVAIDGINFFGATMWTDYNINNDKQAAMLVCWQMLNDYKRIRTSPKFAKFSPKDSVRIHNESTAWLMNELDNYKGQKNVVVTHHAPSAQSLPPDGATDILNAAYASHLDDVMKKYAPLLWVHGHTHKSNDYLIGETRVVSNARGNPYSLNPGFEDVFIIDI